MTTELDILSGAKDVLIDEVDIALARALERRHLIACTTQQSQRRSPKTGALPPVFVSVTVLPAGKRRLAELQAEQ